MACACIFSWMDASIAYYEIYKGVRPLTIKLAKLKKTAADKKAKLAATEKLLGELNAELAELNAKLTIAQTELDKLTEQTETMERQLNAAMKLITGLGAEQIRWEAEKLRLADCKVKLVGDCLACSAFLSYVGPFDASFRK